MVAALLFSFCLEGRFVQTTRRFAQFMVYVPPQKNFTSLYEVNVQYANR